MPVLVLMLDESESNCVPFLKPYLIGQYPRGGCLQIAVSVDLKPYLIDQYPRGGCLQIAVSVELDA